MQISVPARMRIVCRVMKGVCLGAALALPILAAYRAMDVAHLTGVAPPDGAAPSVAQFLIAGGILAVPTLIIALALVRLSTAFRDYARGDVFTRMNAVRLRGFGTALLIAALLQPVVHTLSVLVLTLGFPPGQRLFQLQIGTGDLAVAALGGGVAVVGWVMGEAARLAADVEQIV